MKQLSLFSKSKRPLRIETEYDISADAILYQGDRLELLEQIKAEGDKANLILTSPPYNIGKEYEERLALDEYIAQQHETISACAEILAETGSICWQVGHYVEGRGASKEIFPLDLILYPIFKSLGLILKNRIIWTFGHGLHEKTRFSGRHETILWFVKSDKYIFNLDPIRVPQKYPGKRSFRGVNKGELSGNPAGKNPSDVWDIPNVKSNHVEKTTHPCQFPLGLAERLILALTDAKDLVVDPYVGVGTTIASAIMRDRRGAGADISESYLSIARDRIIQAYDGTIPYRNMNKSVHNPDKNTSVASFPEEWKDNTTS